MFNIEQTPHIFTSYFSFSHSQFYQLITANKYFSLYILLFKNLKMQNEENTDHIVCQLSWLYRSLKWVLRKNETDMIVFCSTIIAFAKIISKKEYYLNVQIGFAILTKYLYCCSFVCTYTYFFLYFQSTLNAETFDILFFVFFLYTLRIWQ